LIKAAQEENHQLGKQRLKLPDACFHVAVFFELDLLFEGVLDLGGLMRRKSRNVRVIAPL
jgi:hypothetical protein